MKPAPDCRQGSPKAAAGLILCFLALASAAFANDDQLVYSDMLNNGWQNWGWATMNFANASPVHSGTASISVTAGGWTAMYLHHDDLDTTLYTNLSFWINGGSSGGQPIAVNVLLDTTGPQPARVGIGTLPPNVWTNVIIPLSALGAAKVTNLDAIQIWNNSGNAVPTFYVDDIKLVAAPPPATVHVGVNATQTVRTVDARLFGVNTAAWDGYLDTPSTLSVLTNINNQALRWPGGSWGDVYHWTNEALNTGATGARNWGSFTTNFIHVATNTHAQVFMIANYGSSSPEEAAYGVRLCNITNQSHFQYWEIGNEVGGSWEEDDNTNAPWQPHDPWTYAQRFTSYYNQMKAVDPTIKIGAVADTTEDGTSNYTNHPVVNPRTGVTHNGWTPVMLTYMRSNNVTPDFLICHNYAPGDGDTYNLLWTRIWAGTAASMRQMLNDYLGSTVAANVELNVTEFGPEGDKQWISLVGGLFYADMVGQIMQTEFNTLLWWDLRNGQGAVANSDNALYGWRTNSSGSFITDEGCLNGNVLPPNPNCYPSYYCMKLIKYFARGGDTVVAVTNDFQLLGTYAVRRTNGSLTLLVVNKSSYAPLTASITLAGYVPSPNATAYSYGILQDNAAATGIGSLDIAQTTLSGAGAGFSYTFSPYSATVLSLAPMAPALAALPAASQPGGGFVFQVQGQPGTPYVIQNTPNLISGSWTTVSTNVMLADGTFTFTNSIPPGAAQQFWRALWQP